MAGNRQHVIPRFLQAGFARRIVGDDVFVVVYRNGQEPFECNTLNVAVEREFYTTRDDRAVDEAITDTEAAFSGFVRLLRNASPHAVDNFLASQLISHFEVRTRHLRQNLVAATDHLLLAMSSFLADVPAATEHFLRQIKAKPDIAQTSRGEARRPPACGCLDRE